MRSGAWGMCRKAFLAGAGPRFNLNDGVDDEVNAIGVLHFSYELVNFYASLNLTAEFQSYLGGDGSGTSPFFSLGAHLVQNVFPASKMLPKCRPKEPQRIPKSIDPRSDAFDLLGGGFMIPPPFPPSHRPRTGQPTQNMQKHTCVF